MNFVLTMIIVFYGVGGNPVTTTTIQSEHATPQTCADAIKANTEALKGGDVAMATCNKH